MKAIAFRSLSSACSLGSARALLTLALLATTALAQTPSRPPGPPSAAERARQPGPWDQDILVYRVPANGTPEQLATFPRGGVATAARLGDGRLAVAYQCFPENNEADFDKVAIHFSTDEGRTWTEAKVIRVRGLPAGMRFPFDPTLVPLPDGRVRIYFTSRQLGPGDSVPAIHSAISGNAIDYTFEPGVRFGLERRSVIDCAVVLHRGEFHLFAPDNGVGHPFDPGRDPRPATERPQENSGYHAVSKDGLTFARVADVRSEGRRRWLGDAKSDGENITFYGTGEGGIWTATSVDGTTWSAGRPISGARAADPGTVRLRDGSLLIAGTGPPRPGTPSAQRRGPPPGPPPRQFRAGAATSNITPDLDVILDGAIMQIGPGKHVHDELHVRCLVLDDGTTRLAFAVCDTTMIAPEVIAHARQLVQTATGLSPDHVLISATHTHSSPRALELGLGEANRAYNRFFAQRIADGIRRAINQLAPAKIGWGSGRKPDYVFNRRWFIKPELAPTSPFGGKSDRVAMNPSPAALVKPAGPVDPEVFVLSVQHVDGRPLALLANYALHYVGGVPAGHISADYYGLFAERMRELLGAGNVDPAFVGIMSNGTSGDVNNIDFRQPAGARPPYERMREVAEGVAQEAVRVVRELRYQAWVPLSARTTVLDLAVRRPDEARLRWAQETAAKTKPDQRLARPAIYARETLELAKYPPTAAVVLQAFRVGDLGIGAAPCEVFAETGLAIKKESPFAATFVIELANGYGGYLPTPEQHAWGGYETWPARSSFLEVGAEPKIRAGILGLLRELSGAGRE